VTVRGSATELTVVIAPGANATALTVVIAPDAIDQLARCVSDRPALVVMDANTRDAVGARVVEALPGAEPLVFEQRDRLRAGLAEVESVRSQMADRSAVAVAVGSGVITDIVRSAAHECALPFISVPTAASMDGYASSVAALEIDGVKVTVPARTPEAIFADPRVLAAAPRELTRAGIGDLLAKATARLDWLAAHLLYGEPFSEAIDGRVLATLDATVRNVEALLAGGEKEVATLLSGLIETGVAIALAGNSRPASGCEHHASHFWDLLAARGRRRHELHGLQVGYATRFAMRLQRFAFGGDAPALRRPQPPADPLGPDARVWLGEPTRELNEAVEEKQRYVGALARWPPDGPAWAAVRARLAPALALFDEVDAALETAGFPAEPGWLGIDADTLFATFRYASRLRARYTTIDFLEGQLALDRALPALLDA
jgi:glycerol-1-phosphate dehydrogenase [NAD(P)+]